MNHEPRPRIPSLEQLRAVAERIGREYGCRLIVLFGSAARAERRAEDLDLALLHDEPLDLVALTNRLIRELGTQAVDLCELRRAEPLLLALVARDGIPLYEADPTQFARFASLAMRRYADTRKFREMERQEIRDILAQLPSP
jgi:predicted nucleotidyltransferase